MDPAYCWAGLPAQPEKARDWYELNCYHLRLTIQRSTTLNKDLILILSMGLTKILSNDYTFAYTFLRKSSYYLLIRRTSKKAITPYTDNCPFTSRVKRLNNLEVIPSSKLTGITSRIACCFKKEVIPEVIRSRNTS